MEIVEIPITEIYCDHEFNCRGKVLPIDVLDLIKSIDEIGLQQPLVVQPYLLCPPKKYRIICGHRRFTALKASEQGFKTAPCVIRDDLDENKAHILNLEENIKRSNLNRLQEANGIAHFIDTGWTMQEIAKELSINVNWVQIRAKILQFDKDIQMEIAAGHLTDDQIRQLGRLKNKTAQIEAVKKIKTAKANGESVNRIRITPKKPKNPLRRSRRDADEIFKLMEQIQEVVGNGFYTRCLGWAAGTVSDFEIIRDLRDFAKEKGITYEIPKSILQALRI